MPKATKTYPEIDEIRDDLNSLKSNVFELTKHMKDDSAKQTRAAQKNVQSRLRSLQDSSKKQYEDMERRVIDKPAQSLAVAFAAGILTSALMRRR